MDHVVIPIGGVYASRFPAVLEAVVGSCIAACLYDQVNHLGGMNHFLLPAACHDDPEVTRYGLPAMQELMQRILKLGGTRANLRAQVFGAAHVQTLAEMRFNVARANERFIREFLAEEEIPLVGERLGGMQPLKVRMFTSDGNVVVSALADAETRTVTEREKQHCGAALAPRWSRDPVLSR